MMMREMIILVMAKMGITPEALAYTGCALLIGYILGLIEGGRLGCPCHRREP
jgi:hypothetical protein